MSHAEAEAAAGAENERPSLMGRLRLTLSQAPTTIADNLFELSVLAITIATIAAWLTLFLPDANVDSARWTLSALAQSMAAIVGTGFVGFTFIWNEAERSVDRMRELRPNYAQRIVSGTRQVSEQRDGAPYIYEVDRLELLRRSVLERTISGQFHEGDGLLEYSGYSSYREFIFDLSRLRCVVMAMGWGRGGGEDKGRAEIEKGLRSLGADDDELAFELYIPETKMKSDPSEFFDVVSRVFDITNLAPRNVDEDTGTFLDEIWEPLELDNIAGLLRRVRRLRELRGWLFRSTVLILSASMLLGLVVVSGYNETTSKAALAIPTTLGIVGTGLFLLIVARLLAVD